MELVIHCCLRVFADAENSRQDAKVIAAKLQLLTETNPEA